MENQSQFLTSTREIADAVTQIVRNPGVQEIYMTGPTLRLVMDAVFGSIDSGEASCETYLVLPALHGSEYLGSSFLYQLYRLASKIRIAPSVPQLAVKVGAHTPQAFIFLDYQDGFAG